ncbi:Uncharacterised protein [Mycobacteroides abscessus subsp. abscessus]|nr:Uncharacterised protein [Mycobacteroides abscessus subsp. abscessus]
MYASRACPYASAATGSEKVRGAPEIVAVTVKPASSDTNAGPSSSRSWSSRGSQSDSDASTESSAHSVVPLKPSTVPDGKSCRSTVISDTV